MAKLLIVDDEPLITAMTEDWLSELGHLVVGHGAQSSHSDGIGRERDRRRHRRRVASQR
jgi:CheY-like chemotaxis protein